LKSKLLIAIVIIFVSLSSSFSQNIRVTAQLDTNIVLVGDTVRLRLTAEAEKDWKTLFPEISDVLAGVDVRSKSSIDTSINGNSYTLTQIITLQPFDTGNFSIPSLAFKFVNSTSSEQSFVSSDSIQLTVKAFHSDTAKTIVDIKQPLDEPLTFWDYLPYIIGGLLLIGGGIIAYRLWKKRKKEPAEPVKLELDKIHYIWALDELSKLEKEKLWQNGKYKLHFTKLSEIIRQYIEKKFAYPALEMTTSELIQDLKHIYIPSEYIKLLEITLNISDLVKFAKKIPSDDECIETFHNSVEFVKKTGFYNSFVEINNREA